MRTVNEKIQNVVNQIISENLVDKVKKIIDYRFFSDDKKSSLISDIIEPKKPISIFREPIRRDGRATIDNITIGFLRTGARTVDDVVDKVLESYPERAEKIDVLRRTTKRRLNNYLRAEKNQNVVKTVSENGTVRFRILENE